ncbi:PREDICTED: uncharacterized protein LOC106812424 isoform X2 [Priapulus caudatus]|uniref:Uncharacterized protein LOC106812424 isoform X2 n=1 Tax=Priapulus caudatus TaxID=37621 RepID=A0ABM1EHW7_PRICU|nr:PREDICTED: uncharacterized protein LOC106812424 isoform X2 [Priapulus caudatus]
MPQEMRRDIQMSAAMQKMQSPEEVSCHYTEPADVLCNQLDANSTSTFHGDEFPMTPTMSPYKPMSPALSSPPNSPPPLCSPSPSVRSMSPGTVFTPMVISPHTPASAQHIGEGNRTNKPSAGMWEQLEHFNKRDKSPAFTFKTRDMYQSKKPFEEQEPAVVTAHSETVSGFTGFTGGFFQPFHAMESPEFRYGEPSSSTSSIWNPASKNVCIFKTPEIESTAEFNMSPAPPVFSMASSATSADNTATDMSALSGFYSFPFGVSSGDAH